MILYNVNKITISILIGILLVAGIIG